MIKITTTQQDEPVFHLRAGDASYVLCSFHGFLLHLYAGEAISDDDVTYLLVKVGHDSVVPRPADTPEGWFSCDVAPFEYPAFGTGDFRPSAVMVKAQTKSEVQSAAAPNTALRYDSYDLIPGKPVLDKCPAVHANEEECDTLVLHCSDSASGMEYDLYYSVMRELPAICRRTVIRNKTKADAHILRAYSASVDFTTVDPDAQLLHLWGT